MIGEFEAAGWVVSADLGPPHCFYSVLMELEPKTTNQTRDR